MAVIEVSKIRIIGFKEDEENVLDCLQRRGVFEVIKSDAEKSYSDSGLDYDFAGVKFAIDFLSQFSDEKTSLMDKISGAKIKIKEKEFPNFLGSFPYKESVSKALDLESKLNESLSKEDEARKNIDLLSPWIALDNNPSTRETENIRFIFGTISEKDYIVLVQKLNKFKLTNTRVIDRKEKNVHLEVVFDKKIKEVDSILDEVGFEKKEIPFPGMMPRESIFMLESLIKKESSLREEIKKDTRELAKELNNLRIIFDILNTKKDQADANSEIYETDKVFAITGWVQERFIGKLMTELKGISDVIHVETLEPKEGEERPVNIDNTSFWSPFESVTKIYGLPQYNEIDPTPILAPFFILFFALCLTDAGYGLILMALSFLAIKVLKVPKSTHKMIRLLGYGGFVTFFVGALFGGWFGIDVNLMPAFFSKIQLINPVENPITVLILSLAIGIFQVIFGIMVSFYWKVKNGKLKDAIFDDATWVFFLVAICLFIGLNTGLISDVYDNFIMIVFWIGLLGVVFAGGRKYSNPLLKIGVGIGSLYGLIGYFSDVLSYSRLLALGLATGIIAMVINMIASLAGEMIPYLGPVVALAILISGHTFNIIINTLGAFIHSGRLQFVEFFPKFMDGGGRNFNPLRRNLKFVEIIDD